MTSKKQEDNNGGKNMLKSTKLLVTIIIGIFLLAACGTPESNKTSTDATDSNKQEQKIKEDEKEKEQDKEKTIEQEDEEEKDTAKEEEKKTTDSQSSSEKKDESNVRSAEKSLTFTLNNEEKQETASLKESDTQDYSLYVLEGYELTGEEPGKDVLYLNEDDANFMRIEYLTNTDKASQEEIAIEQLKAVRDNIEKIEPAASESWLANASIHGVEKDNEKVLSYLIPQGDHVLKLTIFTKKDNDYSDPFIKMAETIEAK